MMLYLVRHAWAVDQDDPRYPDDALRPLTEEGQARFRRMVKQLAGRGFAPTVVATSPLLRCRQTAEIIAKRAPGRPEVVEREELAPHSRLQGLLEWTGELADEEVAWVGHMPDFARLAGELLGAPEDAIDFAKGAIAALAFDGPPAVAAGNLRWLVTAKTLGQ
ncbi:MAG: SixA phosphatase family protein [Pirellulales bacterium]